MLMRAKVIYDPSAPLAEDHVGVEAAGLASSKVANPGHGFSPVFINVGIVLDGEGYRQTALRKHDAAHAPEVEKRQSIQLSVPKLIHRSSADTRALVAAAEAKHFLNAGMERLELLAERLFVDLPHRLISAGFRRQFFAEGRLPATNNPTAANTVTA